jgi:hypothetical protein
LIRKKLNGSMLGTRIYANVITNYWIESGDPSVRGLNVFAENKRRKM